MARAIWKGTLRFGEVAVPVKLYSAVEDHGVHFRLLHEKDLVPVRQHMVNPETGDIVESGEVRRGHEVEPGVFVMLSDEELAGTEPEESRDIEILRFVPPARIDGRWYDRPYYLGPDDNQATYFALVAALTARDREGVARWVMRKKEYLGALRVHEGYLMLVTLHHADEVVDASQLPTPAGRKPGEREIAMARQLVASLEGQFDPTEFQDEYRERVLELVNARAEGRTLKLKKPRAKKQEGSLEEMLRRSVSAAKEGRVA